MRTNCTKLFDFLSLSTCTHFASNHFIQILYLFIHPIKLIYTDIKFFLLYELLELYASLSSLFCLHFYAPSSFTLPFSAFPSLHFPFLPFIYFLLFPCHTPLYFSIFTLSILPSSSNFSLFLPHPTPIFILRCLV